MDSTSPIVVDYTPGSEAKEKDTDQEPRGLSPDSQLAQLKQPSPRSCLACKKKKIRCDKNKPCLPCTRAGRPCEYPPAGPRIRRSKKTIMAEMVSRIATLEKQLQDPNEIKGPPVLEAPKLQTEPQKLRSNSDRFVQRKRVDDILVEKGSSSQYFNEVLLSRVIENDRNSEDVLSESYTATPQALNSSPFNAPGILSSASPSQPPAYLHPSKALAVRLWNTFLENVDGCSGLKLLHVPTAEIRVYSVINDPVSASFENLALCFAIYFASLVSLDDAEALALLQTEKDGYLSMFKVGLEQSLAHGDFLDRPTLTGLHALAIYLSALRFCNRGKGIWVLNGLAIRIAQSLGLHRDGVRLKLSPFQSEMRRRLWWHLLSRDGRASEDYGLENTSNLLIESDVSLPQNVDDQDLFPEMKDNPTEKNGWTSMTFSLIHIELAKTAQKLASIVAASNGSALPAEILRAQIIEQVKNKIEHRLNKCNEVIPQQRMTIFCSRFLLRKLDFVSRLQWALLSRRQSTKPDTEFVTDEILVEALSILKPRLFSDDGLLKQYAWARKAFPQYHVALYVLWHLCLKPSGPHVHEAWEAAETLFSRELWGNSSIGFGSKFAVLTALKAKAEVIRGKIHAGSSHLERDGSNDGLDKDDSISFSSAARASETPSGIFQDADCGMLDFSLDDVWSAWGDDPAMLL